MISFNSYNNQAQLVGAVEYTDSISALKPNECPAYDTKQSVGDTPFQSWSLENIEYPFLAIATKFTLARSGSIGLCLIDGSNRTVWHLGWLVGWLDL